MDTAHVYATGATVRDALAAARRLLGIALQASRETIRSGGEDGCWRCHLASGHIIEVATGSRRRASAVLL